MSAVQIERRSVRLRVTRSDPPAVRIERRAGAKITIIRTGLGGAGGALDVIDGGTFF